MLSFPVVATHQSRSSRPALFSFPPCSHSSLFFSEDYALFSATGVPQPFAYQSLPHSFHCDGGCTRCTPSRRSHRRVYLTNFHSGTRPPAAHLPFFQSLAQCPFCNSFVFTFMHVIGGVPPPATEHGPRATNPGRGNLSGRFDL
jgi:hypothetical protein